MGSTLLLVVSAIYVAVAMNYLYVGRPGMAIAFLGYAVANVGFLLDLAQ